MKKIIAVLCLLCILIPACAFACEGIAVRIDDENVYTGIAYLAMEREQHMVGMLSPTDKAEIFESVPPDNLYLRGVVENGIVRAKGLMAYYEVNGTICGLTKTGCTVTVFPEYETTVADIVARRVGEGTVVSAESITASAQWRTKTTITQIFFTEKTIWAVVGSILFDGAQYYADLCIGDFNGDGLPELGYIAGGMPASEKPKAPEIVVIEKKVTVEKTVVNNCTKIVQDNRQININSRVTNKQTMIVNIGGGCKPCLPKCAE